MPHQITSAAAAVLMEEKHLGAHRAAKNGRSLPESQARHFRKARYFKKTILALATKTENG